MLSTLLIAAAMLLGQADAERSNEDLARQVRGLIRELTAPELNRREGAQQKLLDLGPDILDLLPEPTDRTSAEEKQRLRQVREKLQRAQAEASVRATHVTLQGEMALSAAFEAIEKQTGNAMIDHREQFGQQAGDPKIKLDLNKVPFWQAVDTVLDAAGLTVYPFADKDGVAVVSRPDDELPRLQRPTSYAGAFRVEVMELLAKRSLRNADDKRLQAQLEISWEPRLEPITLQQDLSEIRAVDGQGNEIAVEGADAVLESPITPGELTTELLLPFELPDRSVKQIASLKGKLLAMVPGRVETFRFADLSAKGVEQRKAGVIVVLDQVRKNNDVWEVRVLVRFDKASGALESHRGWIFNNEAYLETADQKRLNFDGLETTRQTEDEVGMAYVFDLPQGPKGLTLVYKTPSVITLLPIEYEIKNLNLP